MEGWLVNGLVGRLEFNSDFNTAKVTVMVYVLPGNAEALVGCDNKHNLGHLANGKVGFLRQRSRRNSTGHPKQERQIYT